MLILILIPSLASAEPVFNLSLPCTPSNANPCDAAWTNASAHAAWAVAIPLVAYQIDGRRGMLIASGTWIAWTLLNEFAFHGKTGGSELRTDLASRIGPTLLVNVIMIHF